MVSTSTSCNQWLSLAKPVLKVAPAGGNRTLVANISKCGWANGLLALTPRTSLCTFFYHLFCGYTEGGLIINVLVNIREDFWT